ncbi:MAG: TonB-dependent receptor [Rhodocyclaceae bacterium]|nr:TonB-dependent receptor [Rhodocyclaceae bacterium]
MFTRKPVAACVALACIGMGSLAAHAQTSVVLPEVRVQSDAVRAGTPRDTVFTGSKTDTALRDLPASVVVVTGENLAEQGTINMNQALENVSGVQPQMAGGYGFADNYFVRGQSMRFMRDGLPDGTSQNGYARSMFDVDRIEVLKGPGSALYGSGQPGGTVNVVSKAPQYKPSVEVFGGAGSFGTYIGGVDITGAIGKNAAARVIVGHEESDGWRDLSRKIDQVKGTLQWKVTDDKTLTIDYDHRDIKVRPDNYGILFNRQGTIAPVSRETHYDSPFNYATQRMDRLSLTHDWFFNADLSMKTAFVYDYRVLGFLRNGGGNGGDAAGVMSGREARLQDDQMRFTTVQNEVTYKVGEGPVKHTLLGGIEFSSGRLDTRRTSYSLPNITNINNPVIPESSLADATASALAYDRALKSDTVSVYAQDQIAFGEQFKLRGGVRQDRVDFSDKGLQNMGSNSVPNILYREVEGTRNLTSSSLGGVWQPTRDWSFYTGVSTGKFINIATEAARLTLEPEKSSQVELGTKATLLDGRLGLNLAYFEAKRDNYYVTLTPGVSTADGHDKSKGVDFDLTSEPIKGLNLLANMVVQEVEVTSPTLASNTTMGVTNRSIAGNRPAGVAEKSGRVWASYTLQSGDLRGLGFGLGATAKSDSYADALNLYKVPGYTVFDAAIFYKQPKWEVALNIRNLADKVYYSQSTFSGALPGAERSALLSFRFKIK